MAAYNDYRGVKKSDNPSIDNNPQIDKYVDEFVDFLYHEIDKDLEKGNSYYKEDPNDYFQEVLIEFIGDCLDNEGAFGILENAGIWEFEDVINEWGATNISEFAMFSLFDSINDCIDAETLMQELIDEIQD